jgi:hypothetical protein
MINAGTTVPSSVGSEAQPLTALRTRRRVVLPSSAPHEVQVAPAPAPVTPQGISVYEAPRKNQAKGHLLGVACPADRGYLAVHYRPNSTLAWDNPALWGVATPCPDFLSALDALRTPYAPARLKRAVRKA